MLLLLADFFLSSSEAKRRFAHIKIQSDIDHLSQFGVNSLQNGGFKGSSHICPLRLPFPPLTAASTPPPPPSNGDSCLSLINAWHLVQRESGDMGGGCLWSGCGTLVETVEERKKRQPGLKKWEVFGRGHHRRRGRGRRKKMRSHGDLDSKTLRQKRQGLTPREPPHPVTLIPLPQSKQ